MTLPLLFVIGFAPGVFWLWYFYRRDRYEPEPQALVLRTAFLGILVAVPVVLIELPFTNTIIAAVIVAPIVEEFAKFSVVRWTIYNSPEFDEPMDGIVYAAAAALGFASIENVGYIADRFHEAGAGSAALTFALRAVLSVPGHVLFSTIWGAALGKAKFADPTTRQNTVGSALALAMLGHAAFNLLLSVGLLYAVGFLLIPWLWKSFNKNVEESLVHSPYRGRGGTETTGDAKAKEFFQTLSMPADQQRHLLPASVTCPQCGSSLDLTEGEQLRGAYMCPRCDYFHQATQLVENNVPEPVQSVQPEMTSVPSHEQDTLSPRVLCAFCKSELLLTGEERRNGEFVCAVCGRLNSLTLEETETEAAIPEGITQLPETQTVQPLFLLKNFVLCPHCGTELELSKLEREEGAFVCPNCRRRTECFTAEEAQKISQHLLAEVVECPLCGRKIHLAEAERDQVSFTCPYCKEGIEYVEE